VIPLDHLRSKPVTLSATIIAIVTHIVCVGLPISLVVHWFAWRSPAISAQAL
jgi:hypothetical protein